MLKSTIYNPSQPGAARGTDPSRPGLGDRKDILLGSKRGSHRSGGDTGPGDRSVMYTWLAHAHYGGRAAPTLKRAQSALLPWVGHLGGKMSTHAPAPYSQSGSELVAVVGCHSTRKVMSLPQLKLARHMTRLGCLEGSGLCTLVIRYLGGGIKGSHSPVVVVFPSLTRETG